MADWLSLWAANCGLDDEATFAIRLCAEEFVTNLVMHGLKDDPEGHTIEVVADTEPNQARIVIVDDGVAFNAATAMDPGREGTIELATVGGRGIRLIRAYASSVAWDRIDGRNQTTFTFKTSKAPDR